MICMCEFKFADITVRAGVNQVRRQMTAHVSGTCALYTYSHIAVCYL